RFRAVRGAYIGSVALGAHELAFNYARRLYVAPYRGRERLVARGEMPVAFFAGQLLSWRLHGFALVLRGSGTVVARHAVEPLWDRAAGMVVFRTGRRLRAFDGRKVRELANRYGLGVKGVPVVEPLGRFVALRDTRRLVLVGYDGRVVASAQLPKRRSRLDGVSSSVVSNAAGTAVAFTATHRVRGTETVYLLTAGAHKVRPLPASRSRRCRSCSRLCTSSSGAGSCASCPRMPTRATRPKGRGGSSATSGWRCSRAAASTGAPVWSRHRTSSASAPGRWRC